MVSRLVVHDQHPGHAFSLLTSPQNPTRGSVEDPLPVVLEPVGRDDPLGLPQRQGAGADLAMERVLHGVLVLGPDQVRREGAPGCERVRRCAPALWQRLRGSRGSLDPTSGVRPGATNACRAAQW
jgi:hypothetical protein